VPARELVTLNYGKALKAEVRRPSETAILVALVGRQISGQRFAFVVSRRGQDIVHDEPEDRGEFKRSCAFAVVITEVVVDPTPAFIRLSPECKLTIARKLLNLRLNRRLHDVFVGLPIHGLLHLNLNADFFPNVLQTRIAGEHALAHLLKVGYDGLGT
jgi:hypothetical protein